VPLELDGPPRSSRHDNGGITARLAWPAAGGQAGQGEEAGKCSRGS
jgi:hypothetical protein